VTFSLSGLSFANDAKIYLFQLLADDNSDTESERTNDAYGEHKTVATYEQTGNKWTNDPKIYWPNQTNKYYFRALSQSSDGVEQGTTDVLWGITPAHSTFGKGNAISPRTNEVPLTFEHAMSKVKFVLETESATDTNAKVNLNGATITISNISTTGTISKETGDITPGAKITAAISGLLSNGEYIVIPQTIGNDAKLTITLTDGTTYSLQLNTCKPITEGSGTVEAPYTYGDAIGEWKRGESYTYTIHLEKEQITFRALIKNWDEKTGSGSANLEWD
jgi:hypothetical protein